MLASHGTPPDLVRDAVHVVDFRSKFVIGFERPSASCGAYPQTQKSQNHD